MEEAFGSNLKTNESLKYFTNACFVGGFAILSAPGHMIMQVINDYANKSSSDWITPIGWIIHICIFVSGFSLLALGWNSLNRKRGMI